MTYPETTPIRRWRILALAGALLLAALATAGSANAQAVEPPPVSCLADNPVDPLGPGFLLDRGKFTTIEHPDDTLETQPLGINNRGQVVGGYDTAGFIFRGFLLDRGRYTTIDVPGSLRSAALRINNRGQILGDYEDGRGGCHGYLLEKDRLTTIDFPGKPTQALGLNDRGQVVGGIVDLDAGAGRIRGFLLDKGVYTPIDFPGALATNALDINARGQIVGFYAYAVGTGFGYLRDANGDFTTIAVPGASLTLPFGINNRGHVVGFYIDANQVRHGFLFKDGALTTIDHRSPPPTPWRKTSTTAARSSVSTSGARARRCKPCRRACRCGPDPGRSALAGDERWRCRPVAGAIPLAYSSR
jgi:probable HAF family extracellular repeat protein